MASDANGWVASDVPMTKSRSALSRLGELSVNACGGWEDGQHSVLRDEGAFVPYRVSVERNARLHETAACFAPCGLTLLYGVWHLQAVKLLFAVDATLAREASMELDQAVSGDTCLPLKGVDVLREARLERAAVTEELHKGVGGRRPIAAGVQLARERVYCRPSDGSTRQAPVA